MPDAPGPAGPPAPASPAGQSAQPNQSGQQPNESGSWQGPSSSRTFRIVRNASAAVCLCIVVVLVAVLVGRAASKPGKPADYGAVNLPDRSAAPDFASVNEQKVIPANVLDAISVPTNATVVSKAAPAQGLSDYEVTVSYDSPSSQAAIRHFFPAALSRQQWRLEKGSGILALHAGSDGNYWDLGVTVGPAPASAGAKASGTRFTMTLDVENDGD